MLTTFILALVLHMLVSVILHILVSVMLHVLGVHIAHLCDIMIVLTVVLVLVLHLLGRPKINGVSTVVRLPCVAMPTVPVLALPSGNIGRMATRRIYIP